MSTTGFRWSYEEAEVSMQTKDVIERGGHRRTLYRALVIGLTWCAGQAGHQLGDYPGQGDKTAKEKQGQAFPDKPCYMGDDRSPEQRKRDGWKALARHGASYGAAQFAVKMAAYRAAGMDVPLLAVLAGEAVEVGFHMTIDDGRLLLWLADTTGTRNLYDLAERGVNGKMLLDQALHLGVQIPAGAVVTGMVATLLRKRGAR